MMRLFPMILAVVLMSHGARFAAAQEPGCPDGQPPVDGACATPDETLVEPVIPPPVEARPPQTAPPVALVDAPNEKWSILALALEIFPSFGVGHYYAGNTAWGIAGTLSNLLFYAGLASGGGYKEEDEGTSKVTIVLLVIGGVGKLVTLAAAPYVTHKENERKRMRYNLELQQRRASLLTPTPAHDPLALRGSRFSPFSPVEGKALLFPILHFEF
ncbi:hypothetical protein KKD52_06380 [Myxococcota bacterium]|nr:hypothetical protein [Myxococcota bacterium]MBU1412008.1 hypothetical protein [Myxococcota bacterium]MBU1509970.1 hypothetical protein [Myxococcota bacterium]